MVTVTKLFEFEACHHLPHYEGACHNLHGHSYKLSVTVGGEINKSGPKQGMIIDFKDLKALVKAVVIDKYDHKCLNEVFDNPTAELMVKQIAVDLITKMPTGTFLAGVKLWETSTSYAEWCIGFETLNECYFPNSRYANEQLLMPAT